MERSNKDKISLTRFILEKIEEAGELTLDALFPRNRAGSKLWRDILGLPDYYEFSPHSFSVILSRLKSQKLIDRKGSRRQARWVINTKGSAKIAAYRNPPNIMPKQDGQARLVVYDIPETERKKREWIRSALVVSGYNQLQRSVWLGYCPLPQKFVKKIYDFGLRTKVHIVSINKSGTLE